jgi:hypothetical protein
MMTAFVHHEATFARALAGVTGGGGRSFLRFLVFRGEMRPL